MAIDVYYMNLSMPARAVLMTMKHLEIPANLKEINVLKKEQMTPEFLKLNPQHKIPTIVDNGFVLGESRAIMRYLANKYAPKNSIYPSDPEKRAVVDRLLDFDIGTFFQSMRELFMPQLMAKLPADPEKDTAFKESLSILDGFLTSNKYVAGDELTIADLSVLASITFVDIMDYDISEYKKVQSWKTKLEKELKYYKEINEEALVQFKKFRAA